MMPRLFVDSSVLIAAIYSTRGYSFDLLLMGIQGKITIVLSDVVVEETRRNIAISKPEKLAAFERAISIANFEIIVVSKEDATTAARYIVAKDAPILAAAKIARVDMLVTLDKKHFLGRPELEDYIQSPILTPAEAFERI